MCGRHYNGMHDNTAYGHGHVYKFSIEKRLTMGIMVIMVCKVPLIVVGANINNIVNKLN